MKMVPVHRLKAQLSSFLAVVRAGGTVVITERGRPVAKLEPVTLEDDPEGHLESLVARGLARRPTEPLRADFFDGPRVKDPDGNVLRELHGERDGDD
jgi:prevent-host-death family protein